MQHMLIVCFSLISFGACSDTGKLARGGRSIQSVDSREISSDEEVYSSADAVGEPNAAPATAEEAKAEPAKVNEAVVPPTQITGAYLVARVVEENESSPLGSKITLGLIAYLDGKRINTDPTRYQSSWSISASPDPAVKVNFDPTVRPEFDRVIRFESDTLDQIRAVYSRVSVSISISETTANSSRSVFMKRTMSAMLIN